MKSTVKNWISLDKGEYTVYSINDKNFMTIPWKEPNFICYWKDIYSIVIQRIF